MNNESFNTGITFSSEKIITEVILESSFTKKIRILLKEGQVMKEPKASFPIVVHLLDGKIIFGVNGNQQHFKQGNIIALEEGVPHDLTATKNSVIRLSLSKRL
jgi:quercetin dioxygenase-like cupin family protein